MNSTWITSRKRRRCWTFSRADTTAFTPAFFKAEFMHHHSNGHHHGPQGHHHEHLEHPGHFDDRDQPLTRDFKERAFTVGVGGPVGSGKTALMIQLSLHLPNA